MYITEVDMNDMKKVVKLFDSIELAQIISFVKSGKALKVVSCRRFNYRSDLPKEIVPNYNQSKDVYSSSFFIKNLLCDYSSYLDYLYINGVEEVHELPITLEIFEILVKALVYCYDVEVTSDGKNLVRIRNRHNDSMMFYSMEYIRETFNIELLERVRLELSKKYEGAKNKIGIEEVVKVLSKNPRINMQIINDYL